MMPDDQAQLIRRLLKKQDEVLERLDQLNAEIEAALKAALPPDSGLQVTSTPDIAAQAA